MSYEIVKSIKIKDYKVYITSHSNNVYPKDYNEWECPSLTKILNEQGKQALDIEILKQYEKGIFQKSNNKYTRALKVLMHMPEYNDFNWRLTSPAKNDQIDINRKTRDFDKLLSIALNTYLPKEKYVISKDYFGQTLYGKKTVRYMKWTQDINKATIFDYEADAENIKKWYTNSTNWVILRKS